MTSGAPFDAAAHDYDRSFTDSPRGRWLRQRVWEVADDAFPPTSRLLDLGCGTGEDAIRFALRGHEVEALDASGHMLDLALGKAEAAGVGDRITFRQVDLSTWPSSRPLTNHPVAGILSNFGALNCLEDLRPIGRALRLSATAGARAILVLMGPFYPVEMLAFILRGHLGAAFRRIRPGRAAAVPGGESVRVWYPSKRDVERAFDPSFTLRRTRAIGLAVPPPELLQLLDRRPRVLSRTQRWEERWADHPLACHWADHYLLDLELGGKRAGG